jgi:hypothetical protein
MTNYFKYIIYAFFGYLGYNNNVLLYLYDNTYHCPNIISINNNIKINNTLVAFNEIPT